MDIVENKINSDNEQALKPVDYHEVSDYKINERAAMNYDLKEKRNNHNQYEQYNIKENKQVENDKQFNKLIQTEKTIASTTQKRFVLIFI